MQSIRLMGDWLTFCGPVGAWLTFCGYPLVGLTYGAWSSQLSPEVLKDCAGKFKEPKKVLRRCWIISELFRRYGQDAVSRINRGHRCWVVRQQTTFWNSLHAGFFFFLTAKKNLFFILAKHIMEPCFGSLFGTTDGSG